MASFGIQRSQLWNAILCFMLIIQTNNVICYQYKVGDLNAWNLPPSANKHVYTQWVKYHKFNIGDSLLFLYPPSQDSVIQVTEESFRSCNLTDPILYMNNGNSLFNITSNGVFYFTSGTSGHCEKSQKLQVSVGVGSSSSAMAPSDGPAAAAAADSPSYQNAFGTIPAPPSSSPPAMLQVNSVYMSVTTIAVLICAFVSSTI